MSEYNLNSGHQKNVFVAILLWFFLGYGFGAHNYYLGRFSIGIAQLIFLVVGYLTFISGVAEPILFAIGAFIIIFLGFWWLADLIYVFKYTNTSNIISLNSSSNNSKLDELEKLHNLLEKGVITKPEFESKKQKIMENY